MANVWTYRHPSFCPFFFFFSQPYLFPRKRLIWHIYPQVWYFAGSSTAPHQRGSIVFYWLDTLMTRFACLRQKLARSPPCLYNSYMRLARDTFMGFSFIFLLSFYYHVFIHMLSSSIHSLFHSLHIPCNRKKAHCCPAPEHTQSKFPLWHASLGESGALDFTMAATYCHRCHYYGHRRAGADSSNFDCSDCIRTDGSCCENCSQEMGLAVRRPPPLLMHADVPSNDLRWLRPIHFIRTSCWCERGRRRTNCGRTRKINGKRINNMQGLQLSWQS